MSSLTDRWGDVYKPDRGSWSHHDCVRHFLYEQMYAVLEKTDIRDGPIDLLEIGSRDPTSSPIRMFVYRYGDRVHPVVANYPETDIRGLTYSDSSWDVLVADQVLEHVERPWLAADEIWRVLRSGGLALIATPFIHPIHPNPIDCWRIAPDGYKVLFPANRWETLGTGAWGNREIVQQEYASPVTLGMSGDWCSIEDADRIIPAWRTKYDKLNPVVLFGIYRKI